MRSKIALLGISAILASGIAFGAEVSTGPVTIVEVDTNADVVYFTVSGGSMCGTTVFTLDGTRPRFKEMFANLLAAAAGGKKVKLATWSTCKSGDPANAGGNWGTEVQGLYVQY